jgi:peptidoglycan/xylan/chitin deacetylase (PgdA/CDA1 family)
MLGGAIQIGPDKPAVALTFDDGPSAEHTPLILDQLAARGARATFFVLGVHVEAHPTIAQRIAKEQELACHSHAHTRDIVKSPSAFRADVARFREVVSRETGVVPRYYRFPWGDRGTIAPRDVLALEEMTCVHWSASSGDDELDGDAIVARIERNLEPGAILLLHDGVAPHSVRPRPRDRTVAALPRILDAIAARGLRAVTVSELLR